MTELVCSPLLFFGLDTHILFGSLVVIHSQLKYQSNSTQLDGAYLFPQTCECVLNMDLILSGQDELNLLNKKQSLPQIRKLSLWWWHSLLAQSHSYYSYNYAEAIISSSVVYGQNLREV